MNNMTKDNEMATKSMTLGLPLDYNEKLAEHFTLGEMCHSDVALARNIANVPTALQVENLRMLCQNVLEPLRKQFGVIRITSGFRSQQLNSAVGGKPNSQHKKGEAADIHLPNMAQGRMMYDFIKTNLVFDQLLFEHSKSTGSRWLHVSFKAEKDRNRMQAIPNYQAA